MSRIFSCHCGIYGPFTQPYFGVPQNNTLVNFGSFAASISEPLQPITLLIIRPCLILPRMTRDTSHRRTPVISQALKPNKQLSLCAETRPLWRDPIKAEPRTFTPIQVSVELHSNLLCRLLARLSTVTFFCLSDH